MDRSRRAFFKSTGAAAMTELAAHTLTGRGAADALVPPCHAALHSPYRPDAGDLSNIEHIAADGCSASSASFRAAVCDLDASNSASCGDGLPAQRVVWVENGVVKHLDYTRYWSQRHDRAPSGTGISVDMSDERVARESARSATRSLLVTRFWSSKDPRLHAAPRSGV